ncbi:MAG: D-alanine--D-alanine ligase [Phycisphaerales bacterium]|nr:D-alanine--D-alanine ligase [Phycisphaerales bacterium]
MKKVVLVLGGGPDAEREVSLLSSRGVADALAAGSTYDVNYVVIERPGAGELAAMRGDVVFPVLHGPFGEGGGMQDLLAVGGRPFVGCGPHAARTAMDKVASKLAAASLGVRTAPAHVLNEADGACPMPLPVVVKPVHEGSSVGVHICRDQAQWAAARDAVAKERSLGVRKAYMVEAGVLGGSEITVGVLDGKALPIIRIVPSVEFYDYEAKYNRDDTRYEVNPGLPAGVAAEVQAAAESLARAIGVRHLCRVDFLLDREGRPWFLEVNTMPGFTSHSLLPMAAKAAGLDFPALAEKLVGLALRDR